VRDGVITHDEILSAAELPVGWTEEQEGGTYRLVATGTDEVFDRAAGLLTGGEPSFAYQLNLECSEKAVDYRVGLYCRLHLIRRMSGGLSA
jgi:hypothetical protein